MLGTRHATLGDAISVHRNRLWRHWVALLGAASAAIAAVAAWSSALRLAAIGDHARASGFALQGALATSLALAVCIALALRALERVIVYERGLVHRGPWRSRAVRFSDVRSVDVVHDALGTRVSLSLEGGRELPLGRVSEAARLASLVRAAAAR